MSETTPWLSLLVPFHDVETYLRDSVRSALSQSDAGVEIILLDDASSDGSTRIARRFATDFPDRVRYVAHARNLGISAARNRLLAEARGRYLWFLDSDDLLMPGAIARLREVVREGEPDLVLCDFRTIRGNFDLKHRLRGELHRRTFGLPAKGVVRDAATLAEGLLSARQSHVWSKIAIREVWRQVRFPDGRMFEDVAVMPALITAAGSFRYVPEPWVGYRQRRGSIMASQSPRKIHDLLLALRELHAGLVPFPGARARDVSFAADYYCLRMFAWIARKFPSLPEAAERPLDRSCREAMADIFPQGAGRVLDACRARGWRLRAWRLRGNLRRRGWL